MDEFIQWYCSEPRLSFNKIVVTRILIFLEIRNLASGTINGCLATVKRLAYEAADAGLLSPEPAAGIRRVEGVKKLGVRLGTWSTADEARRFWPSFGAFRLWREASEQRLIPHSVAEPVSGPKPLRSALNRS
jgi:hypothetical protein